MDKKTASIIGFLIMLGILGYVGMSIYTISNQTKKTNIYVHNPFQKELILEINEEEFILQEDYTINLKLKEGKNHLVSKIGDSTLIDTLIHIPYSMIEKGGMINLSKQPLYLWTESYGSQEIEEIYDLGDSESNDTKSPLESISEQLTKVIKIDSVLIIGNIKEIDPNKIAVIKTWNYELFEDFEESIQTSEHLDIMIGKRMSKIFSKPQILKYWQELISPSTSENEEDFTY